jgi:hypothetical protein
MNYAPGEIEVDEVPVPFGSLLGLRLKTVSELFAYHVSQTVTRLVLPYHGLILFCDVHPDSDEYAAVSGTANAPVFLRDRRIITHNFADAATWETPGNSAFQVRPASGKKLAVHDILVRFSKNAHLTEANKAVMSAFVSLDGATPVSETTEPIFIVEYPTIGSLIFDSDLSSNVFGDNIGDYSQKFVEVSYRYADPYTLKGSPVFLSDRLGEYIEVRLSGNGAITDINNDLLAEQCTVSFICKTFIDF